MQTAVIPLLLYVGGTIALAVVLLLIANLFNPGRVTRVKEMPYESGMTPVHDTRRRFDIRFHLLAIAFLVFDVELLFLYPWAVVLRPAPVEVRDAVHAPSGEAQMADLAPERAGAPLFRPVFVGGMVFFLLLGLGLVYDWRKGVFRWR